MSFVHRPFPLDKGEEHFTRLESWDHSMVAPEDAGLSGTTWNSTSGNTHQLGDRWIEEDLSIYSRDDAGRALDAVVRPDSRAGTLISSSSDCRNNHYELAFTHRELVAPSEIFIPALHFPHGVKVICT